MAYKTEVGLSGKVIISCFLRSSLINAAYNLHGLQNIPFLHSILPGLAALYPDKERFYAGCRRYASRHNCHPFWAPFLTGAFLHLERDIATGRITPEFVAPIKDTALNSLSALGDSFINGSLVVTLFLVCACILALGYPWSALLLLLFWLLMALCLKLFTFYIGLSRGFSALTWLRRIGLNNKGDYLKLLNSVLLASLLALIMEFPPEGQLGGLGIIRMLQLWLVPVASLMTASYLVNRFNISRTALLYIFGIVLALTAKTALLTI